jgi:hypothetical protein
MANDSVPYLPFSQRAGLEPIPPQLKLGEVSAELRRLLDYYINLEIDRKIRIGYAAFGDEWKRVAMDLHVLFFKHAVGTFDPKPCRTREHLNDFVKQATTSSNKPRLASFLIWSNSSSDTLVAAPS